MLAQAADCLDSPQISHTSAETMFYLPARATIRAEGPERCCSDLGMAPIAPSHGSIQYGFESAAMLKSYRTGFHSVPVANGRWLRR